MHIYIYIYIYVYTCIYIYIYDEDLLVMQKWQETLNTSEKVKIHLARALLMNPEARKQTWQ